MKTLKKIVLSILLLGVLALLLAGWLGLQIKPASWPPIVQEQPELASAPLPNDLPAPEAQLSLF